MTTPLVNNHRTRSSDAYSCFSAINDEYDVDHGEIDIADDRQR